MDNLMDSFSLTIKIGTEKVKFTIQTHQSTDSMFQKLKVIHPQCQNKKEETLRKLKHDLQSKLKTHNVKQSLIHTIEYYLRKNFKEQQTEGSQVTTNKQIQTKMADSLLTTQNISLKASPKKDRKSDKQQKDSKNSSKSAVNNQVKDYANAKAKSISMKKRPDNVQKYKSQPKKQHLNEDLVKAYQTILQKSTQQEIKMMAKKCLEEIGKLPQAERKVQPLISRKHEFTLLDIKTDQKQLKIQEVANLPSQKRQTNSTSNQQSEKSKTSERSPYPRLFATNKYNYMPNNPLLIDQTRYSLGQFSLSTLKSTNVTQRKFNYLNNIL